MHASGPRRASGLAVRTTTTQRLARLNLSDRFAQQVQLLIQQGEYRPGDRLPSIPEMARGFGVGHPTVREGLKKLEALGVVRIRPGSGVYVGRAEHTLVMAAPHLGGGVTRKLLLDLIEARIPLETLAARLAAAHASAEDLSEMRRTLTAVGAQLPDTRLQNSVSMVFHRQIGLACGNTVLAQLLDVLRELFAGKQRLATLIRESRRRQHQEHLAVLRAIEAGDAERAGELMAAHLEGVRQALLRWEAPPPREASEGARISA